jgi:hypothetical protein
LGIVHKDAAGVAPIQHGADGQAVIETFEQGANRLVLLVFEFS